MQSLPDHSPDNNALAGNELELSDAEREALAAGGDGTPPANAEGAPAAGATPPAQNAEGTPAAGADAATTPEAAAAAAAAAEPVVAAPAAASAAPVQPFVATLKVEERDFEKELADNKASLADLRAKHAAGEIDDEAYEAQFDQLQDQKVTIKVEQSNAALAQQINQQSQDQTWEYLQKQFLAMPDNAAIAGNKLLFAAWEAGMQDVVNEAAQAGRTLTDWDLFAGARQKLVEAGMLQAGAAAVAPAAAAVPPKPDRTPPLKDVPTTLSAVPAGADALARSSVDQMADADSIEDLEDKFSGMSDAAREQLLAGLPGSFVNS